jgi:hypothetical protein
MKSRQTYGLYEIRFTHIFGNERKLISRQLFIQKKERKKRKQDTAHFEHYYLLDEIRALQFHMMEETEIAHD